MRQIELKVETRVRFKNYRGLAGAHGAIRAVRGQTLIALCHGPFGPEVSGPYGVTLENIELVDESTRPQLLAAIKESLESGEAES